MVPLSGLSSPAMMLSQVVLQQPLAPTRHTNSPSATFRLTRSSARTAPDAPLNLFETFSATSLLGLTICSSSLADDLGLKPRRIARVTNIWKMIFVIRSRKDQGASTSFEMSVEPL